MIQEHIEYLIDLLSHFNNQKKMEQDKLLDYERLLMIERNTLKEKSIFTRWASGNLRFAKELENLIKHSEKNIDSINQKISDNKDLLLEQGVQQLMENSSQVLDFKVKIDHYNHLINNIQHIQKIIANAQEKNLIVLKNLESGKNQSIQSDKNRFFQKSFDNAEAVMALAADLKRYINLEHFINNKESDEVAFFNNIQTIVNDILVYKDTFSYNMLDLIRAKSSDFHQLSKYPSISLMSDKSAIIERISRNLDLLMMTFNQELKNINLIKTDILNKSSELENTYKIMFLNKIKKSDFLIEI